MLSIGKLTAGREEYYLSGLAATADEYYLDPTEIPGSWAGALADPLGVWGRVDPGGFRAVLAGRHPRTGTALVANADNPRRVTGFDLTFSAPKSVSVLWALGDAPTAETVAAAHDRAVAAAVAALEGEATFARRGHAGARQAPGDGLVTVGFGHRTSRAGDPQIHTHVVVANLTRSGEDGRWSALDGRAIYGWAKTVGYLYQAALRAELTDTLGVTWAPVHHGAADIAGLTADQLQGFSQRRAQITAAMEAVGTHSARSARAATLATRPAKDHHVDLDALRHDWTARADTLGIAPHTLTGPARARRGPTVTVDGLLGADGLTAQATSFDRRSILQALAAASPDGHHVDDLRAHADAVVAHPDIRRLGGPTPAAGVRYSTAELLAVEARLVEWAAARTHEPRTARVEGAVVETVLGQRPTLSAEQTAMIRQLVGSGAGVQVVIGKAGAGKTYALDAAHAAWNAAGYHVIGAALAARAAAELQAGAGIPSTTIDRLLADLDRPGPLAGFAPHSVLVVDEVGMVGTRKLDRLLTHAARAHTKVVLVGDPRQLPEIDAGGALAALARRIPPIHLADNRRQTQGWERAALDQLRAGSVAQAVTAYAERGRITLAATAEDARTRLVDDWYNAHRRGAHAVMYALRRDNIAELNRRARIHLRADGTLTGANRHIGGVDLAVGDRVLCLRNDRRLGITNGTTGTVTRLDADHALVDVGDGRPPRSLPGWYLDAGHVTHAYATTIHKSQGATVDRAFVLGSDTLFREAGYVALSRAQTSSDLYLVGDPHTPTAEATVGADPVSDLIATLGVSRAQALALDQHPVPAGPTERFEEIVRDHEQRRADLRAQLPDGPDRQRWIAEHPDTVDRYRAASHHLAASRAALGAAALADPPLWLVDTLGAPPVDPAGRDRWATTAATIVAYRQHYGIADTAEPLGPEPPDGDQRRRWDLARLAITTRHLDRHLEADLEPEMELGL